MQTLRQGDILLKRIDKLPSGLTEAKRDDHNRVVLALGEAHGHAHAFRATNVTGFRNETAEASSNRAMVDYIMVGGSGADLKHELASGEKADHEPINVPEGNYQVVQQREQDVNTADFTKPAPARVAFD